MYDYCETYEDSVMAYANNDGQLDADVLEKLFDDHGSDVVEFLEWSEGSRDARLALNWLGY